MLCIPENVVDGLNLLLHEITEHLVLREIVSDEGCRGMGTVSCTESVIDVAVCIGSEFLDKLLLAGLDSCLCSLLLLVGSILCETPRLAFLLGIEAEVFKKENLTRLQCGCLLVSGLAVFSKLYRNTEAL